MDWIILIIVVWLTLGLIPSMILMFARARKMYYVDPLAPLIGALQGPYALWTALQKLRKL